jgi:ribosomal protein S18 acetylase RimI-like enzyme
MYEEIADRQDRTEIPNMRIEAIGRQVAIRQAVSDDSPKVAELLGDVAQWLERTSKWNDWPKRYPVEQVLTAVEKNELFIAEYTRDGAIAGTFTLQWNDERFWGSRPPDAGYIHRVAVVPHLIGQGIGTLMIRWCGSEVGRRDRRYLRLDCPAENARLQAYYEGLGFLRKGEQSGRHGYRGVLYEVDIRELSSAAA